MINSSSYIKIILYHTETMQIFHILLHNTGASHEPLRQFYFLLYCTGAIFLHIPPLILCVWHVCEIQIFSPSHPQVVTPLKIAVYQNHYWSLWCDALPVWLSQSVSRGLFAGRGRGGRQALRGSISWCFRGWSQALMFAGRTGSWASSTRQRRTDTLGG